MLSTLHETTYENLPCDCSSFRPCFSPITWALKHREHRPPIMPRATRSIPRNRTATADAQTNNRTDVHLTTTYSTKSDCRQITLNVRPQCKNRHGQWKCYGEWAWVRTADEQKCRCRKGRRNRGKKQCNEFSQSREYNYKDAPRRRPFRGQDLFFHFQAVRSCK